MKQGSNQRAVFLDRDGTLMEDPGYVGRIDQVRLLDGAVYHLQRLAAARYHLFVVTNQSGVARGYFNREAVDAIHDHLDELFRPHGVQIERYLVCPHHPDDGCVCRKPNPTLLLDAVREYGLDLEQCFMIGDKASDVATGINAGARSILVLTGEGRQALGTVRPAHVAGDLSEAVDWILAP